MQTTPISPLSSDNAQNCNFWKELQHNYVCFHVEIWTRKDLDELFSKGIVSSGIRLPINPLPQTVRSSKVNI